MAERRVTLGDVAQRTGLSLTTVSRVVNGEPDVPPHIRALVEEQLERSGYRRRVTAAVASGYLQIVVPGLSGDWVAGLIDGVREAAARSGHGVSVVLNEDREAADPAWVDDAISREVMAVVILLDEVPATARQRLRAKGIPFVVIDPAVEPAEQVPAVSAANWSGGLEATRHLLALGHRRIAVISGRQTSRTAVARVEGYRAAMTSAGIEIRSEWVRFGEFTVESGEGAAAMLLNGPERPTAIFAASDMQAVGVLDAAVAAGLVVPRDLSVVGFDDLSLARYVRPQLTTVRQPLREMAHQATKIVLDLVDHPALERPTIELATRLIVRDSTAALA